MDLLHLLLPMQHLYMLLRNAADVHNTPLRLGPCRTRSSWLQTCGHLYDTPGFECVMVWTVYEMASFGRGLGISLPFLGCQPDALIGAYCGDASQDARGERMFIPVRNIIAVTTNTSVSVVLLQHVLPDGNIIFVVPNASCV